MSSMTGNATTNVPQPQNPMAEILNRLENQLAKIEAMSADLSGRLFGPTPSNVVEATPAQSHILGRLQDLSQAANRIESIVEALHQQL